MPKIHMLIGIPGSGKSFGGREIAERENAAIYSSDELRKELYGNESEQKEPHLIFAELEKRMKADVLKGNNVVFDATNISRKRRVAFIKQFKKISDIHGHVFLTDLNTCIARDSKRERTVGEKVISKMYKNFQMPLAGEGFEEIEFYLHKYDLNLTKEELVDSLLNHQSYEVLFETLKKMDEFHSIWELPQDSTYHSFSASRHTYYVYDSIHRYYEGDNKLEMLLASVFHDLGKGYCKSFLNYKNENTRYANFIGHENVSAYLAINYLWSLGVEPCVVMGAVELISLHMYPKNLTPKVEKNLINWVGHEQYQLLNQFNEYDNSAK